MVEKATPQVVVGSVLRFVDLDRLLGFEGRWTVVDSPDGTRRASAHLARPDAADVQARLRGVTLGGRAVEVTVSPPLARDVVRKARLADARRRRDTTPGFLRPGTKLDEEGRISLTPEVMALAIARTVAGRTVVDATCGCGGNAIAFAREGCRVIALDTSEERIALARHNARVYGVETLIQFHHGDGREWVGKEKEGDVLFVDPPWASLSLLSDLLPFASRFATFLAKLPPSFDPSVIPGAQARVMFGEAEGDYRRAKMLLIAVERRP